VGKTQDGRRVFTNPSLLTHETMALPRRGLCVIRERAVSRTAGVPVSVVVGSSA
jgi:hypothetical protein